MNLVSSNLVAEQMPGYRLDVVVYTKIGSREEFHGAKSLWCDEKILRVFHSKGAHCFPLCNVLLWKETMTQEIDDSANEQEG